MPDATGSPPFSRRRALPSRSVRGDGSAWVLARVGGAPVVIAPTSALLGLLIIATWFPVLSSALGGLGTAPVLAAGAVIVLGVLLSVGLHELAHGMTGTLLGRRPLRYELYLWGGLTSFGPAVGWRPWKDVLTSLSGPATNLLLWAGLGALVDVSALPVWLAFGLWAVARVNLALAVFNALPALPLDGGHALAAVVSQVTGRAGLGRRVAAWTGLAVLAALAWLWVLAPLVLHGRRPGALILILVVLVAWPIATTCWRESGLGGRARAERAARALDLRGLARPVAVAGPHEPLTRVRALLEESAAVVLVVEDGRLLGVVDRVGLEQLGEVDERASAAQVCTALPAQALTTEMTGPAAAQALREARTVSRWLLLVEGGRAGAVSGAVPTGAR